MAKKPLRSSAAVRRHGVLPTYSLAARLAQGLTNEQATSSLLHTRSNRQIYEVGSNNCIRFVQTSQDFSYIIDKEANQFI